MRPAPCKHDRYYAARRRTEGDPYTSKHIYNVLTACKGVPVSQQLHVNTATTGQPQAESCGAAATLRAFGRYLVCTSAEITSCKVVPVLATAPRYEDVWGCGGIAAHILNFGTRWRWVASFTPRPLYSRGKSPWYPLNRRLGGPQSWAGCGGEETFSARAGNRTPVVRHVA
jgi:hypothetical protein